MATSSSGYDHSSAPVLHIEFDEDCSAPDEGTQYYGLFDPESKYNYDSGNGYFYRDAGGAVALDAPDERRSQARHLVRLLTQGPDVDDRVSALLCSW